MLLLRDDAQRQADRARIAVLLAQTRGRAGAEAAEAALAAEARLADKKSGAASAANAAARIDGPSVKTHEAFEAPSARPAAAAAGGSQRSPSRPPPLQLEASNESRGGAERSLLKASNCLQLQATIARLEAENARLRAAAAQPAAPAADRVSPTAHVDAPARFAGEASVRFASEAPRGPPPRGTTPRAPPPRNEPPRGPPPQIPPPRGPPPRGSPPQIPPPPALAAGAASPALRGAPSPTDTGATPASTFSAVDGFLVFTCNKERVFLGIATARAAAKRPRAESDDAAAMQRLKAAEAGFSAGWRLATREGAKKTAYYVSPKDEVFGSKVAAMRHFKEQP
ncbi:hypothetical protein M885DRAFT_576818 [Pelagophyceae sp. CCMP2097]|nr:hypothetical protein M885DRAFT_576818 [Pelagophyceae sp. CCMP2097]